MNDKKQEIGGDFNGQFINGDINNNHHHYNPPGSITFNLLNQPATGIHPDVSNLLSSYSKPRNEYGLPGSQPVILGPDAALTTEQRRTLNDKVNLLESSYGQSGKATWSALHRIIGTKKINDMTQRHFSPTETILDKLLQIAELESRILGQQQAAELATASQHQLKKDNEQLTTENAWLRKRTQQPCPGCHDKESRLASTRHQMAAVAGAALCAFVTAGYFALQG